MGLKKKGKHWYATSQADIRAELLRYSRANYPAEHYADAVCNRSGCDGRLFELWIDETQGVAVRVCARCKDKHPVGDSGEYLDEAELEQCECPCGSGVFEITAGAALYEGSGDVKWLYVGCRCPGCGLTACYADWKNEFPDYRKLLERV